MTASTTCIYHKPVQIESGNTASIQFSEKNCITEYITGTTTSTTTADLHTLTADGVLIGGFLFVILVVIVSYLALRAVIASGRIHRTYTGNNSVDGKEHDVW